MGKQLSNELKIAAKTKNLKQVLSFVDSVLNEADCLPQAKVQINIAAEEIFVNIAYYAYPQNNGEAVIKAEITDDPKAVIISFFDSGVKYDPLARPDPDLTVSVDDRPIGGLGIFMTKELMDEVSYEYRNGQNVFVMKKYL